MAVVKAELYYLDENGEIKSTPTVYGLYDGVIKPMELWVHGEDRIGGEVWDEVGLVADKVGEQWEVRTLPDLVTITYYMVVEIGVDPEFTELYRKDEVYAGSEYVILDCPSLGELNADASAPYRISEVTGWSVSQMGGDHWEGGSSHIISESVDLYCYVKGYYKG